jgi:hypothetical protein
MKTRELYIVVLLIFFAAGLVLPATQASNRPRPVVAAVLRVLFPLDRPLHDRHVDDSVRAPINVATTLAWGALVAFLLSRLPWFRSTPNANQTVERTGTPPLGSDPH